MPLLKFITGGSLGCLGLLVMLSVILGASALFWGWPIMVIAGAFGWHIPYFWASVALGLGFSFIAG